MIKSWIEVPAIFQINILLNEMSVLYRPPGYKSGFKL